ncbi:hypothetical protein OCAR_6953 [Afipia carboxidovorans OM5]|nr:hypothetical protein OCAR_6953 [Afipia carboxidovorans OM5]
MRRKRIHGDVCNQVKGGKAGLARRTVSARGSGIKERPRKTAFFAESGKSFQSHA